MNGAGYVMETISCLIVVKVELLDDFRLRHPIPLPSYNPKIGIENTSIFFRR
jgi:hypothetical protein